MHRDTTGINLATKSTSKSLSAIEEFCEKFDRSVRNSVIKVCRSMLLKCLVILLLKLGGTKYHFKWVQEPGTTLFWKDCKFEYIAGVLEMKTLIYWSESNSWIYFYRVLNKNWKMYWSEQSFTGLGKEDRCSLWGL
jgi:hypothetical protein